MKKKILPILVQWMQVALVSLTISYVSFHYYSTVDPTASDALHTVILLLLACRLHGGAVTLWHWVHSMYKQSPFHFNGLRAQWLQIVRLWVFIFIVLFVSQQMVDAVLE